MPAQTRPSARFSRPGATTTPSRSSGARFSRSQSPARTSRATPSIRRRRAQPQQSGPQKALKAVGGLLPSVAAGKATKKTAKAGKKPLGLALVAGAGALAFSQRDRLKSKLPGGSGGGEVVAGPTTPGPTTSDFPAAAPAPASGLD